MLSRETEEGMLRRETATESRLDTLQALIRLKTDCTQLQVLECLSLSYHSKKDSFCPLLYIVQ